MLLSTSSLAVGGPPSAFSAAGANGAQRFWVDLGLKVYVMLRTSMALKKILPDRIFPRLLFLTSRNGLKRNIGAYNADYILDALSERFEVFGELPAVANFRTSINVLKGIVTSDHAGIVILGGYDVVAPCRYDTLYQALRDKLPAGLDWDEFEVWSDSPIWGLFERRFAGVSNTRFTFIRINYQIIKCEACT